jgi:hypothetical protein
VPRVNPGKASLIPTERVIVRYWRLFPRFRLGPLGRGDRSVSPIVTIVGVYVAATTPCPHQGGAPQRPYEPAVIL